MREFEKQGLSRREYSRIHTWLIGNYGKANKCTGNHCTNKSTHFDWALKKDALYEFKVSSFEMLCRSCHMKLDYSENRGVNGGHNKGISTYKSTIKQYSKEMELIKEWNTLGQIKEAIGVSRGNIGQCINGQRKTAGGFIWKV